MPNQKGQYALFEVETALPIQSAELKVDSNSVPASKEKTFSDYVVYVDESGDHSLVSIDKEYPVFVLAFCVFHKRHYSERIIPAVEKLKFNYFGHDSVVLHEHEIRKQTGAFKFLIQRKVKEQFFGELNSIMQASNFVLITCIVDKQKLNKADSANTNPYHVALSLCLSSLQKFLQEKSQAEMRTHVVVECRGRTEDNALELEFRRICDGNGNSTAGMPFEIVFADKKTNLTGLQLADLVARPVGINYLRPEQPNQAFEMLKAKFYCEGGRSNLGKLYDGVGRLVHPHSAK